MPFEVESAPKIEIQQQPYVIATYPIPEVKETDVERIIRQTAKDFPEVETLVDIARCESGFNAKAKNKHSTATGIFQILDMHGLTVEERQDPVISTRWAMEHFNGGHPWDSSRHCWGYKTSNHKVLKSEPSPLGTNCVKYASSKAELPNGLGTLAQKKSHIISSNPEPGKIGVTAEGSVGHLIVVEKVHEKTIEISEGNYRYGYITWREIPKELVLGYL